MKKLIILLLALTVFSLPIVAQADFSGTAEIGFTAACPEDDDFNSLLNPGNIMELREISMNTSLTAKLDAGDEKTTFSAWFSLKEYPIGQALLAGTYDSALDGDPTTIDQLLTGEFIAFAGDTIFSLDVMRFSANVYLNDLISMEAGRQSMLTGYGYGWNPIDFANPLKDPADPDAALRGVDGLSFKADLGYIASLKLYGILPDDMLTAGVDLAEVKAGGEITIFYPGLEVKLAGFYDYDETSGSDAYTPSLGVGFMADLFGIGFYNETALRKGSRNSFTDGLGGTERKDDWLVSILAGLEYTFSNELYLVAEYLYNGEGFDKEERALMEDSIIAVNALMGGPTSDLIAMYSPGYFARHYVMVNIMQPLYDINTDLNFSMIFSPDSGALTVLPSVSYTFSGNFTGRLEYAGLFDLYGDDFSEVAAQPVKQAIQTVFTYSY